MDIKTTPNFLPEPVFFQLSQAILNPAFTWYLMTSIVSGKDEKQLLHSESKENNRLFYMNHLVYQKENYFDILPIDHYIMDLLVSEHAYLQDMSTYYDVIGEPMPEGQFLGIQKENVIRIRINFIPNTSELQEHAYHRDYDYSHKGALLSLNTCDGYTKILETGTKYPSIANTLLTFDTSKDHCSTTTTDALGRFNIVINYL